jgi:hypothetical protein
VGVMLQIEPNAVKTHQARHFKDRWIGKIQCRQQNRLVGTKFLANLARPHGGDTSKVGRRINFQVTKALSGVQTAESPHDYNVPTTIKYSKIIISMLLTNGGIFV